MFLGVMTATRSTKPLFREKIAPLLSDPGVEFIGEIDPRRKAEFLVSRPTVMLTRNVSSPVAIDPFVSHAALPGTSTIEKAPECT
jgi:hypothetical protein